MQLTKDQLRKKARATCDLLMQSVLEVKTIEMMLSVPERVRKALPHLGIDSPQPSMEMVARLFFEVICFAGFLIMVQETPKHIRRRRLLFFVEPDAEGVRYFNTELLNPLNEHFNRIGPEIQSADTTLLSPTAKVAEYLKTNNRITVFGRNVGLVFGPENYVIGKTVAITFIGPLVDTIRLVLRNVFSKEL